jgi:hypothetical protein
MTVDGKAVIVLRCVYKCAICATFVLCWMCRRCSKLLQIAPNCSKYTHIVHTTSSAACSVTCEIRVIDFSTPSDAGDTDTIFLTDHNMCKLEFWRWRHWRTCDRDTRSLFLDNSHFLFFWTEGNIWYLGNCFSSLMWRGRQLSSMWSNRQLVMSGTIEYMPPHYFTWR